MNLLDYDALIKITVRVINKQIIDNFNVEIFQLKTYSFSDNDYFYYMNDCIREYCNSKDISQDIEVEKLPNGLHFFIIGFNLEGTYDYEGEYTSEYIGTVLSHNRPINLNEVRLFLINYESSLINPNENKINRLYEAIERENKRERCIFLFNGLKDS